MTALVATRHPTCPVVTLVGTEGTNTVAASAKADGRRTPSAVFAPKRLLATRAARSTKHQLQHVDSDETKYYDFFQSPLKHYQSAVMLIDNSIMKSFGAKLDWTTERLSFQDSKHTVPAIYVRRSIRSQYCSFITQTADTQSIPVLVSRKHVVPAAHEALIRVSSTVRPEKIR